MFPVRRSLFLAPWALLFCLASCTANSGTHASSKTPPAPEMPSGWNVESDVDVPSEQIDAIADKLGAKIESLRNTVYDVYGKRVQLNVIVAPDSDNADKLMVELRTMKSEEGLLQDGRTIYEFVGKNDILPIIADGRRHLESQ